MIRDAGLSDAAAIAAIYNHYIENSVATFEEEHVSTSSMTERIVEVSSVPLPWLVADDGESGIVGFANASGWNGRCAYRRTAETTVYLAPTATGSGLGTQLYDELFKELKRLSFHVAIGGVALPNDASVALHEKVGMNKVAHFSQVGYNFGRWVDVGYWQCFLD